MYNIIRKRTPRVLEIACGLFQEFQARRSFTANDDEQNLIMTLGRLTTH